MQSRLYKAGSIIFFMGDKADMVYLIKQGQAQSIFISVETGLEARETVNAGEFIGVKSILGMYQQEETVQCLTDCFVIIFTYEEFEKLVAKNTPILIKMLRVFSNQLRRINKKVRDIVENHEKSEEGITRLEGLFNIGEFYFKNKKFKQALYAYRKYIQEANEDSVFYNTAIEQIEKCKNAIGDTEEEELVIKAKSAIASKKEDNEFSVPLLEDDDDLAIPSLDEESNFDKAVSLYDKKDYKNALKSFSDLTKDSDSSISENATFFLGKCYFQINQYDNAARILSQSIQKNSKASYIKEAINFIAKSFEAKGDKAKAVAYYEKVLSIPPQNDSISEEAKVKITAIKG